jgi:plastocyanin
MSEKEYIISLNKGVDFESFNQEMITSTGSGNIPKRSVDIANLRPCSERNIHYMLTDEEAVALRNDPRVYGVTLLPESNPDLFLDFRATQVGDFTKTTLDRGNFLNWGMRRMNEATNPYDNGLVEGGYNYTLDGTGVDVVIMDSGLQIDHPEFQDANGASRVQQINWTTASGIAGMPAQSANYYRDFDGHGTHVAGTVAGKTYGWAKNSRVFSLKLSGLEGSGDTGTGTSLTYAFDCIKLWHRNKPIDPATGAKRPTVVNMSWGFLQFYDSVSSLTYRGTTYTGEDVDTPSENWDFGLIPIFDGQRFLTNVRIPSVDVDMEELIDEGVHVCVAAGNRSHKIDVPGGLDYDNTVVLNTGTVQYHRGSSPYSLRAHIVGNIDSVEHSGGLEQKAVSSETGPGVSVYAPGTDIMSAMSNTNRFSANTVDNPYPANDNFLINNISGTSMASPQVAGMLSLWLQLNSSATPEQGLAFVNSTAKVNQLYDTGNDNDYRADRSLLGGENRFAFNKFNSNVQLRIGNTQLEYVAPDTPVTPTYSVTPAANNVNEGSALTINVATTNITDGSTLYWTVTNAGDFATSSGSFTINSNSGSFSVTPTADATTEGPETFTVQIRTGSVSGTVVATSSTITINDTSTTPVVPTYAVTPTANNVNEGIALTINVATTNVNNGTTLYWTVTNAGDFITSSGSFTINSNAGSFTVTPAADAITEGPETFTVSIRTSSTSGTIVATSSSITINDTSITPAGTIYNVTVASGTNEYGPGNKYYIDGFGGPSPTLNLIEGETYVFRQSDSSNATHPLRFSTTADGTWGAGVEYTDGVIIVGTAGQLGAYTQITVPVGAPTLYYYCVNHSGMGGTANTPSAATPVYDSVTSPASANEGSVVTFTVNTQNVDNGTTVGYTITGIDANDLSAGSLTGNITITSNTGTVSVTLANDLTTEGTETMTLTLAATDSAGTNTGALSSETIVNDTSTTPSPTYTITPTANNVDEGSPLTFNVGGTNITNGTYYWTVSRPEDFDVSSGSFTITSNVGSFNVTPTADVTTEGPETFTASVRTGSTGGTIVATSSTVTINDTSTTPAPTADYTINVTNSGASAYILSGNDRNGAVSGNNQPLAFNNGDVVDFVVNASGHPFFIKTAAVTGTGSQASGVTNNGAQIGTVQWTVGSSGTFYYICQFHGSMVGTITAS